MAPLSSLGQVRQMSERSWFQPWGGLKSALTGCLSLTCFPTTQAVRRFLKLECKCHGVSGSCTLRTCWRALSDFRRTGDYLRRRYDGAVQVTATQDGANFTAARQGYRRATRTDLVYFDNSPDYCVLDKAAGE